MTTSFPKGVGFKKENDLAAPSSVYQSQVAALALHIAVLRSVEVVDQYPSLARPCLALAREVFSKRAFLGKVS